MNNWTVDLSGQWQFKEFPRDARCVDDLEQGDWDECSVPNSIFYCLEEAGKLDVSQVIANPRQYAWVSERPWIFRKRFDIDSGLLHGRSIELALEGLDTVATVWVNQKLLGRPCNMFRSHRFDISDSLKAGENEIMVKFDPAENYARGQMGRYIRFQESDFTNPHRVYLRKAQFQFGWDFSPSLPGCGIIGPVRICGCSHPCIDDVYIRTVECDHAHADLKIDVRLNQAAESAYDCRIELVHRQHVHTHQIQFKPGELHHSSLIRIDYPQLWWPAGYGRPNRYSVRMELKDADQILDIRHMHTGIRTVRLIRHWDKNERHFYFEINGKTIHVCGANWVPPSVFIGSIKEARYRSLIEMAADAGVNMLRVWGGGHYESNVFYELCEEHGILIWQDFMFACGYYPEHAAFLDEVKAEACAAVGRLRNFCCIALWCGNNEIDWMHSRGALGKGKKYYGKKIFHHLLKHVIDEYDPGRDYIETTPLAYKHKYQDRYILAHHQWQTWSGYAPIKYYQPPTEDIPPFVTEFGFQSCPSIETLSDYLAPAPLRLNEPGLEKLNYQIDGISRMYRYMVKWFGPPKDLNEFIYLSQLTQARAMKIYIEYLRMHPQQNYGQMVWQFNDACCAMSWSVVDYQGRPKALYYYLQRLYRPVMVGFLSHSNEDPLQPVLEVPTAVVLNGTAESLTAKLQCRLMSLQGQICDEMCLSVSVMPHSLSPKMKLPRTFLPPEHPSRYYLDLRLEQDGIQTASNLYMFGPDKYMPWSKPKIKIEREPIDDTRIEIRLTSNRLVKDAYLRSDPPSRLADNFIDLKPNEHISVPLSFDKPDDCRDIKLTLLSINDILAFPT